MNNGVTSRLSRQCTHLLGKLIKGDDTAPLDYTYDYESRIWDILTARFETESAAINSELLAQGQLQTLIEASYNPTTGLFREDLFINYFNGHFDELYIMQVRDEVRDEVYAIWEAGSLAYLDENEQNRHFVEDSTRSATATTTALATGAAQGATGFIYLSAIALILAQGGTYSEVQERITTFLREGVDNRAGNYYNMVSAWGVNQARNFGRLSSAYSISAERVTWVTAGDELVCDTCAALEGLTFSTGILYQKMADYSQAPSMAASKAVLPWVKVIDGFMEIDGVRVEVNQENADTLAELGIGIPGIHGRCRCSLA